MIQGKELKGARQCTGKPIKSASRNMVEQAKGKGKPTMTGTPNKNVKL